MRKRMRKVTRNERIKNGVGLVLLLYAFVVAIETITHASLALAPDLNKFFVSGMNPIKAIATGWFTTIIVQSSGAVGSITAALAANEILILSTAVFILIGASLGTTIKALLISVITVSQKRRDFRHGFEIGLCYSIYSALLVGIVFILEFFFGFFSKTSLSIASKIGDRVSLQGFPNILDIFTRPVTNILYGNFNNIILILLGLAILVLTLRFLGKTVIGVLGGEDPARSFINRHFNSKLKTYFLGAILTAIVFSSSITIGLLVPLAVARLINLKKAIPFILGADLGTSTDVLLASIVIGNVNALATFVAFALFAIVGALIFLPNTEFLWKLTKNTSKKVFRISRKKALYFLIAFILIPLLLMLIF
jgi:sodium-dependent phosphate cotransporter